MEGGLLVEERRGLVAPGGRFKVKVDEVRLVVEEDSRMGGEMENWEEEDDGEAREDRQLVEEEWWMEGREASVCEDRRIEGGGGGEVVDEEDGEVVTVVVEGGEVTEERRELLELEFCEALVVVVEVVLVSLRALTVALEGIVVVVVSAMSD